MATKRVIILTRQEDGSWTPSDEEYTPRQAEKLTMQARILAGIQSRIFPAEEWYKLHPDNRPE